MEKELELSLFAFEESLERYTKLKNGESICDLCDCITDLKSITDKIRDKILKYEWESECEVR